MKLSLYIRGLLLLMALSATFAAPLFSRSFLAPQTQGNIPPSLVPKPFPAVPEQAVLEPIGFESEMLKGRVSISTYDKKISIKWGNDDVNGAREYFMQVFSVAYWPTAAFGEGDILFIAGKNPSSGHTIVEKWTLSLSQLPAIQPPSIAKATLFDKNVSGQRVIRLMEGLHANGAVSGAGVLVQFEDSHDFYSLDTLTGAVTLVVSAYAYPGLEALDLVRIVSGEHPRSGYVYVMTEHWGLKVPPTEVVLIDADKDGTIDSVHMINSDNAWSALDINVEEWTTVFP